MGGILPEEERSPEGGLPVVEVCWSSENAIGVREIDDDHFQLFALANEVFRAAERSDADLRPTALKLFSYARRHFAREEALMASIGFPELDKHRRRHDRFTDVLARIMAPPVRPDELCDKLRLFMLDWILRHILSEDRRIGEYMDGGARTAGEAEPHAV